MGCGCRGNRAGSKVAGEVLGYDYISPSGQSYFEANGVYLFSLPDARAEQRAHGGGTIKTIRRSA